MSALPGKIIEQINEQVKCYGCREAWRWHTLRTQMALTSAGYLTPEAAAHASDADLLSVKGFGLRALQEFRRKMGQPVPKTGAASTSKRIESAIRLLERNGYKVTK